MHKKFEINWTKIKGSCQSGRKVVTHDSKSDLPLILEQVMGHFLDKCSFLVTYSSPVTNLMLHPVF